MWGEGGVKKCRRRLREVFGCVGKCGRDKER